MQVKTKKGRGYLFLTKVPCLYDFYLYFLKRVLWDIRKDIKRYLWSNLSWSQCFISAFILQNICFIIEKEVPTHNLPSPFLRTAIYFKIILVLYELSSIAWHFILQQVKIGTDVAGYDLCLKEESDRVWTAFMYVSWDAADLVLRRTWDCHGNIGSLKADILAEWLGLLKCWVCW